MFYFCLKSLSPPSPGNPPARIRESLPKRDGKIFIGWGLLVRKFLSLIMPRIFVRFREKIVGLRKFCAVLFLCWACVRAISRMGERMYFFRYFLLWHKTRHGWKGKSFFFPRRVDVWCESREKCELFVLGNCVF
jgi:hypothetical protein